ncbi:glycosyltransferase [Candidatus Poribacteria bacterium]|nr:glycosyltransferase [Candidatus Poribacteria bacterium]
MKKLHGKKILIIVENLPVPFDRRVWQEAKALKNMGATVSVICPKGRGFTKSFEIIQKIAIYRHNLPLEARRPFEYLLEYPAALIWEFILSIKCFFQRGFDVIHACDPPDLVFLIVVFYKLFGKKFIFDHHDLSPELYIAKFGKRGIIYRTLLLLERLSFRISDISIATNESFRDIAISRGKKKPEDVFMVRSGPETERIGKVIPNKKYKNGRKYLVGYLGVIGKQDGVHFLVEACNYLVNKKKRKDIQFICMGGGTELENIKQYAREKNVSDYIEFTGMINRRKLIFEILGSTDVCIATDVFNEMNDKSTMNKIMEYMVMEKPIVQFDLKEGKLTAGSASLYAQPDNSVDMAEKILQLIEDPEKRKEMGTIGYKRIINEMAWKYEKDNLIKAYMKLFCID